jgi:hypothetical protein
MFAINVTEAVLNAAIPTPWNTRTSRKGQKGEATRYAPELTAKRRLPPIMKLLSGLESNRLPMTGLNRRDATL